MNKVINPLQFKQQVMDLLYQPAPSSPDLTQLLPELKPYSSHKEFVFPGERNPDSHASVYTANAALKYERFSF